MQKYHLLIRAMHWLLALLIVSMLIVGFTMSGLSSELKMQVYPLHKSVGITILFLMFARLLIRIFTKAPPLPRSKKFIDKVGNVLAKVVHYAFYVTIFSIVISGYTMSSAGNRPMKWFFDVDVPLLIAPNKDIQHKAYNAHSKIAFVIVALLVLHILGFIKHLLIDKTNLLKRIF